MEFDIDNRCMICGHPLSPNNKTGIGCECKAILDKIIYAKIWQDEEIKKNYYNIKNDIVVEKLISLWDKKGSRMRSEFKKEFIPSVIEFYNSKNFLTKKQQEMSWKILFNVGSFQTGLESEEEMKTLKEIHDKEHDYINKSMSSFKITREEIEACRTELRKQGRKVVEK